MMSLVDILVIPLSFILTIFLAAYSARSLFFYVVATACIRAQTVSANSMKTVNESTSNFAVLHQYQENNTSKELNLAQGLKKDNFTSPGHTGIDEEPFVSIIIASYNEAEIINRLLDSCSNLKYNKDRFEIIIVDDSDDATFSILQGWQRKTLNAKIIHRENRKGWKGGALNEAIRHMNVNSSYAMIVDADNILPSSIVKAS